MKANRQQNNACEQQAKFIQERITSVEKHFADLCTTFGGYTRKTAAIRDKSDETASALHNYAESENVNKSLKNGLYTFSSTLSVIGDHRDAQVQRLDAKVVAELSQYEGICKHAKEEVRNTITARDRELARKRHLDRIKERNPRNKQQISQAESELLKASADVSRTVKVLEEQIDMFEKKKLHDIRTVLLDYVTIELSFHAKAVELFTKAYQEIAEIDEEEDLEDFRNALHVPESVSRLDTVKRTSFRNNAFSISSLFTTPPAFKRAENNQGIPHHSPRIITMRSGESVDSMKSGLESSSLASIHVEDYVEGDNDLSSDISDEDERRNVRKRYN